MEFLLVGLGNPGSQYSSTKHNIGWMVLEHFLGPTQAWKEKFKGHYLQSSYKDHKIISLKPQTFMNLSGESVVPCAQFFKIAPASIIVLHDELDLPFGQVSFKKDGGLAGHNGLKSIAAQLGTQDFYRMRIGIGRPARGDVASWVLAPFSGDDLIQLPTFVAKASEALGVFFSDGYMKALNTYNKKTLV